MKYEAKEKPLKTNRLFANITYYKLQARKHFGYYIIGLGSKGYRVGGTKEILDRALMIPRLENTLFTPQWIGGFPAELTNPKRFKGEMIRILKIKLRGDKSYDRHLTHDSGLSLGQPILHRIGLRRRSASDHGQSQFCEGETVGEILAMPIDGGERVIIVDMPPRIAGELVVSY